VVSLKRLITIVVILFLLSHISACGEGYEGDLQSEYAQLTDLILVLSTRTGITSEVDLYVIEDAAKNACVDFRSQLGFNSNVSKFIKEIGPSISTYRDEYSLSETGAAGSENRALAMHNLLNRLYSLMGSHHIDSHQFYTALLHSLAKFDLYLEQAEGFRYISPEANELVDFLSYLFLNQISSRNTREYIYRAFNELAEVGLANLYKERTQYLEDNLIAQLKGAEEQVSDSSVLSDVDLLVRVQLNLYAQSELALLKFYLEDYFMISGADLSALVDKMQSVGGVMASMTPERLIASGVLGGGNPNLSKFVVADWVQPDKYLSYQLNPLLEDRLTQLGGVLPTKPSTDDFEDPYLVVFKLDHDLIICAQISLAETRLLEDEIFNSSGQLPSFADRLDLFLARENNINSVIDSFDGLSRDEAKMVASLLIYPLLYSAH